MKAHLLTCCPWIPAAMSPEECAAHDWLHGVIPLAGLEAGCEARGLDWKDVRPVLTSWALRLTPAPPCAIIIRPG